MTTENDKPNPASPKRRSLSDLSPDERLDLAKSRTRRLIDHLMALFLMHETNRIVIYSSTLTGQVPRSFAANAFNQFQRSMHLFEVARLCAMWDRYGDDRESIPTIVRLIDHEPSVVDTVVEQTRASFATEPQRNLNPSDDPDVQATRDWWERERVARSEAEASKARERLTEAIEKCEVVKNSPEMEALERLRHTLIGHNLDLATMMERTDVQRLKNGDEGQLLDATVEVADLLNLGLNGSGFDWEDSRRIARRNAAALWNGCKFDVLE